MPADGLIDIELAYSPQAGVVELSRLRVGFGTTALQAVHASELLARHPALAAVAVLDLGIWGQPCEAGALLQAGDRLEVYRALRVDPKEARRQRYRSQPPTPKR